MFRLFVSNSSYVSGEPSIGIIRHSMSSVHNDLVPPPFFIVHRLCNIFNIFDVSLWKHWQGLWCTTLHKRISAVSLFHFVQAPFFWHSRNVFCLVLGACLKLGFSDEPDNNCSRLPGLSVLFNRTCVLSICTVAQFWLWLYLHAVVVSFLTVELC